jgi:hypothetical protein
LPPIRHVKSCPGRRLSCRPSASDFPARAAKVRVSSGWLITADCRAGFTSVPGPLQKGNPKRSSRWRDDRESRVMLSHCGLVGFA